MLYTPPPQQIYRAKPALVFTPTDYDTLYNFAHGLDLSISNNHDLYDFRTHEPYFNARIETILTCLRKLYHSRRHHKRQGLPAYDSTDPAQMPVRLSQKLTRPRYIANPEYHYYARLAGERQRCFNPAPRNHRWHGRGIMIAPFWRRPIRRTAQDHLGLANARRSDPIGFLSQAVYIELILHRCPQPGFQIDRINNAGPYAPSNTKWSSSREQRANQSRSRQKQKRAYF